MTTHERNTSGLAQATQKRVAEKRAAAEKAIKSLLVNREPIGVAAVARHAGVSQNHLYQHSDLLDKIRQHQSSEIDSSQTETARVSRIESTLRVHIRNLEDRHETQIRELNKKLNEAEQTIQNLSAKVIRLRNHRSDCQGNDA